MKKLALIFAVALAIRLAALAWWLPELKPDVDRDDYRALARNLVAGKGFVAFDSDRRAELPNVARTPVYPLFLAGLIKFGGDRLGLFLAVQCLLGALMCALTAALAKRWLPVRAAPWAGWLLALDPNSVVRCCDLLTEVVFTFLLLAGLWLIANRAALSWQWWLAGLVWAVAALCRPIAAWLWVIAVSVAFATASDWRRRTGCAALFLVGFLAVLGVWAAHNARLTGHWFVATIATHNLRLYRAAGMEAEQTGATLDAVQRRIHATDGDVQFFESRENFDRTLQTYRQQSWEILRGAPVIAAKQAVKGWGMLLFSPGAHSLDNIMKEPKPAARWWPPLYTAGLVVLVVLAGIGAMRLGRDGLLLTALVVYFVVLAGGPEANSRFRMPVMPALAILAVAGARRRA